MNYSTWIILLASINVLALYSGFPMGTKKAIVIVTTLGLLFIGFIFRAIEKRQRKRILERKQSISRDYKSGIDAVAEEVAHDIHNQVEHEIDTINHQASIAYHDETSQS